MNKLLIKICGVTELEVAAEAVKSGANMIGLVFHPASKRYVTLQQATLIATQVLQLGGTPVAVFVDHCADEMQLICQATGITTIQLHGDIAKKEEPALSEKYTRIFVMPTGIPTSANATRDYLLYDSDTPGSGKMISWDDLVPSSPFRWILAGGLTPENLPQALSKLNPNGVDVSTGVESQAGVKDISLIKRFIDAARGSRNDN